MPWPAITGIPLPPDGQQCRIRPSPVEIEDGYAVFLPPDERRPVVDRALAELRAREKAQRAEERRVGLMQVDRELRQLVSRWHKTRRQLRRLTDQSHAAIAATVIHAFLEERHDDTPFAEHNPAGPAILRLVRDATTDSLRKMVDDLIAHPMRERRKYRHLSAPWSHVVIDLGRQSVPIADGSCLQANTA